MRQAEAAALSGMTQSMWSRIECGRQLPSLAQAAGIEALTRGEIPMSAWLAKGKRRAA
jgi:transcriptional regulator with XRE-family HTH domain